MAKAQIDVYRDWLGIQEPNRPLTYYQILRLNQFEDNVTLVRDQYRKINAHVRKYATGEYYEESQVLLNELAKAMLCLTDATRKLEYDMSLGRKVQVAKARRSIEEILVQSAIVPQERLAQIKRYADGIGIDLHEAVLQQKLGTPESVMLAYAEAIGLPFVSLEDVGIDEEYAPQINPNTARMHSFVPIMSEGGSLLLASPRPVNPDVEEELRMIFEMPVRSVICTPADANAAIMKQYPKDAVQLVRKKSGGQTSAVTAAKSSKSPKKQEVEDVGPMSEDEKKNRQQYAVLAFTLTVTGVMVGLNFAGMLTTMTRSLLFGFLAVCVAGVASFVTWTKMTR